MIAASNELLALAATNRARRHDPHERLRPRRRHDRRQHDEHRDPALGHAVCPGIRRTPGWRCATLYVIAALLVRPDGSTIQAVNFDRATGRVRVLRDPPGDLRLGAPGRGARGGRCTGSRWPRPEPARPGAACASRQRIAGYVRGICRPPGCRCGTTTPAGRAGRRLRRRDHGGRAAAPGRGLPASPEPPRSATGGWVSLSRRMLAGALRFASARPPAGAFAGPGPGRARRGLVHGGELMFGLTYALEALRSAQRKTARLGVGCRRGAPLAWAPWPARPRSTPAPPAATRRHGGPGSCPGCGEWNTLVEEVRSGSCGRGADRAGEARAVVQPCRCAASPPRSTTA